MEQISERYLIFQRVMTFLDEWLLYGLLLYLFVNDHLAMMVVVAVIGGTFVANSYRRQWAMEASRFGPVTDTPAPRVQEGHTPE
jgi:hypothetical protein